MNITGGNWYVEKNGAGSIEVTTDNNEYLCIGFATDDDDCTYGPITQANADLIASAPRLYSMLEHLLNNTECDVFEMTTEIEELLSEARGESK